MKRWFGTEMTQKTQYRTNEVKNAVKLMGAKKAW